MNNTMPYYPFQPNEMNNYYNQDINEIKYFDNRIKSLEKEIINLKNRIAKLEKDNNMSNYQPNSYNMM